MKSKDWQQIETLFLRALECEPGERAALLDQSCSGDEALRHRIEALLIAREQAGSFMKSPAFEVAAKLMAVDEIRSRCWMLDVSLLPYNLDCLVR